MNDLKLLNKGGESGDVWATDKLKRQITGKAEMLKKHRRLLKWLSCVVYDVQSKKNSKQQKWRSFERKSCIFRISDSVTDRQTTDIFPISF